jgi:hypothetical protein
MQQKIQKPFKELTKIDDKTRDELRKMGNILGRPSNNEFPANINLRFTNLIEIFGS